MLDNNRPSVFQIKMTQPHFLSLDLPEYSPTTPTYMTEENELNTPPAVTIPLVTVEASPSPTNSPPPPPLDCSNPVPDQGVTLPVPPSMFTFPPPPYPSANPQHEVQGIKQNALLRKDEGEFNPPVILYQTMESEQDVLYNPDLFFNKREFIMRPDVEYLLLLYGTPGSQLTEQQHISPSSFLDTPGSQLKVSNNMEPHILSLLVKHVVPNVTVMVPYKTPLSFLLNTIKLKVKMVSLSIKDAERARATSMQEGRLAQLPPVQAPYRLVMFMDRAQRPKPYPERSQLPPPSNLLLRRLLTSTTSRS